MKISARNVFEGKITALKEGPVNAEVELSTEGGDKIVAIITETSVKSLDLGIGKSVVAVVKAPWVTVVAGTAAMRFSARNQLSGKVDGMAKGAVNSNISVALKGGSRVHAIITNEAVAELGLSEGAEVSVLFKASHVILGVPA